MLVEGNIYTCPSKDGDTSYLCGHIGICPDNYDVNEDTGELICPNCGLVFIPV